MFFLSQDDWSDFFGSSGEKPKEQKPVEEKKVEPVPVAQTQSPQSDFFSDVQEPAKQTSSPTTKQVIQEQVKEVLQQPQTPPSFFDPDSTTQNSKSPKSIDDALGKTQPIVIDSAQFDMNEAEHVAQLEMVFYGYKGVGKTTTAFSLPGKIVCISFDKAAQPIKEEFYNNSDRIRVFDGIRYYDESDTTIKMESAMKCIKYVLYILDNIKKEKQRPDWIILDAAEVLNELCEMKMRHNNNLRVYEGFANRVLWRERNMYFNQVRKSALDACVKGLAYTLYPNIEPSVMKGGEIFDGKRVPKWAGNMERQTHIVFFCDAIEDKTRGRRYTVTLETSKKKAYKSGLVIDTTDNGVAPLFSSV